MFLWRKNISFNEQLSRTEQREMIVKSLYSNPDQNLRKFLGSLDKIYEEIMASDFKDDPGLVYVHVVLRSKELYQGYSQTMYFGKFVCFLSTVPAGHEASGKATDLLNRMFPSQKKMGKAFFSPLFMEMNISWKYYLCGHENPDLDSLVSVLLTHYVMLQAPDYRPGRGVAAVLRNIAPWDKDIIDQILDVPDDYSFVDAYYTLKKNLTRQVSDVYTPTQVCLTVQPETSIERITEILNNIRYALLAVVVPDTMEYSCGINDWRLRRYLMEHVTKNNLNPADLKVQDFIDWHINQPWYLPEMFTSPNQSYNNLDLINQLRVNFGILPVIDAQTRRFCGFITEAQLTANTRKVFALDTDISNILRPHEGPESDIGGVINHHHQSPSALFCQNEPVGSTATIILGYFTAFDWIKFPPRHLLLGLATMVDDTDGWLDKKVTERDKIVFSGVLKKIPAEFTWGIGENDSERMTKVIQRLRNILATVKQDFYKKCFAEGKFEETGFLHDQKTISGILITQVMLNAENDNSFNTYNKFVFKYTDDLAKQDVDLNIFMKTYYKSEEEEDLSQCYDDVLITSANAGKLSLAENFLKENIKGFDGENLTPELKKLPGHEHTIILRYPAGTVFSRKVQFSEEIIEKLYNELKK
jgi:inorganic pyrophosphatase/exopolyphosphatase